MTSADFDPQYGYPPAGSPRGRPGGLGTRFFARLIDGILINIVVFLVSLSCSTATTGGWSPACSPAS